jgi:hypothetical protein
LKNHLTLISKHLKMSTSITRFYALAFSLIALLFGASSCMRLSADSTKSAEDHALAEGSYNDVNQIANEAATGGLSSFKTEEGASTLSACATITHDSTSSPRQLIIDFGTVNCLCADGRNRRGKILVSYTGRYRDAGSVHNISFDNYYVDDNKISGTKVVTNMGLNSAGHSYFSIHVDGSIEKADGRVVTWVSDRQREWLAGESTSTKLDDVYLITGSASGTTADGDHFTANITVPLRKALACRWIESGSVEFTPGSKPTRTIDFGTGSCDDEATISARGRSKIIHMR